MVEVSRFLDFNMENIFQAMMPLFTSNKKQYFYIDENTNTTRLSFGHAERYNIFVIFFMTVFYNWRATASQTPMRRAKTIPMRKGWVGDRLELALLSVFHFRVCS